MTLFQRSIKEWRVVFWIMVVILLSTNFVFLFYGSGDTQEWNEPLTDNSDLKKVNPSNKSETKKENSNSQA